MSDSLGLNMRLVNMVLQGFGGGPSFPLGEVDFVLSMDEVEVQVIAVVRDARLEFLWTFTMANLYL